MIKIVISIKQGEEEREALEMALSTEGAAGIGWKTDAEGNVRIDITVEMEE